MCKIVRKTPSLCSDGVNKGPLIRIKTIECCSICGIDKCTDYIGTEHVGHCNIIERTKIISQFYRPSKRHWRIRE